MRTSCSSSLQKTEEVRDSKARLKFRSDTKAQLLDIIVTDDMDITVREIFTHLTPPEMIVLHG